MSRQARAAICRELNRPVVVEEITVDPPKFGEVTVKLAACGVCHSDLSATNGTLAMPLPLVLGHEAAGEVIEVGPGVDGLKEGDHVVSSFIYMCGECRFCVGGRPVLCIEQGKAITTLPDGTVRTRDARGQPVNVFSGCGVMAEYATLHKDNVVKIDRKIPLDRAALVGCAVTTGVGAVFNTARVVPGSSVAVIGCGGVGLNVIQGARVAGAGRIIAVDQVETKLALGKQFGATDVENASQSDPVGHVMELTGQRGVDVAFEVIGLSQTIDQTITMTRRGGQAILVGVPRMDVMINVPAFFGVVLMEKTIKGCWYGSSNVQRDVPKLLDLYRSGELKLEELISRTITLDQVNEAFDAMKTGEVARSVIEY